VTAALVIILARLPAAVRGLRPGYAARLEREWRDVHGMARHHPESLTRALRRREERRLAALRAELWPDNEYEAEL
jgi:hypothetical protein